ncbi:MAG: hypothetical protein HOP15_01585 [Planctomycetes bacterium]|nr:hypothetical protein [Planctomycetota bacterium]
MLIDEETTLKLTPERVVLEGGMRYSYLTGWFEVSPTRVGRSQDSKDEERQTRELKPLSQVANSRIEELARAYPALERVRMYARVVALLRMAMAGQQLVGVDLTSLAGVEAISQERFPTPDAVKN